MVITAVEMPHQHSRSDHRGVALQLAAKKHGMEITMGLPHVDRSLATLQAVDDMCSGRTFQAGSGTLSCPAFACRSRESPIPIASEFKLCCPSVAACARCRLIARIASPM